jgi:hypothetical protein
VSFALVLLVTSVRIRYDPAAQDMLDAYKHFEKFYFLRNVFISM